MAREYAWSLQGERARAHVPKNWGDNVTMIGALGLNGLRTLTTLEGAMDTEAFETFVGHFLAPTLKAGDFVLWDNLSVHKAEAARRAIEAVGATLVWLPAYSPDLNPIENCWSKLKSILRSVAARTRDDLDRAIAKAMATITSSDAAGWFRNAGYQAQPT
jgi:transposase